MASVTQLDTVYLNGNYYPITDGGVRLALASIYPPKRVEGDTTKDSHPRRSIVTWDDLRGGLGVEKMDVNQTTRFWRAQLGVRHKRHLVLPRLTETGAEAVVGGTIPVLVDYTIDGVTVILAALNDGTEIYGYDNARPSGGNDWHLPNVSDPDKLHDIPGAAATDAIRFVLSGTEYVAFAAQTHWTYNSNHDDPVTATWVDRTEDVDFFAFWDRKLWGIDNDGQLWWTSDVAATPTNDANLQDDNAILDGDVVGMFVGPDLSGEPIIYVSTKVGLFAHDKHNERFLKTSVAFPRSDDAVRGATWNGDIYQPVGLSVYRYSPQQQVLKNVGLDLDDGLADIDHGKISHMTTTHTQLVVSTDPQAGGSRTGGIFGYDGQGWNCLLINSANHNTESLLASDAYGAYRLWWARDDHLLFQEADISLRGPDSGVPPSYQALGWVLMPWFDAGEPGVDKLAIQLKIECRDMTANEVITPIYYTNYSASGQGMTAIATSGVNTRTFVTAGVNSGVEFQSIQLGFIFSRGSTVTLTPGMVSFSLEYRKKLELKQRWSFTVDLTKVANPDEMHDNLIVAAQSNLLVPFNYEGRTGADTDRDTYVDIEGFEAVETTGDHPAGIYQITVVEP